MLIDTKQDPVLLKETVFRDVKKTCRQDFHYIMRLDVCDRLEAVIYGGEKLMLMFRR